MILAILVASEESDFDSAVRQLKDGGSDTSNVSRMDQATTRTGSRGSGSNTSHSHDRGNNVVEEARSVIGMQQDGPNGIFGRVALAGKESVVVIDEGG